MTIPDHVIEEVRERAEILEVIGAVVPLKRRGKNWVGLCPFHPEKTPSFNVSPDKQMYYCFGCQAGGNVLTFVMEHDRLPFPEAVRSLAERTGVEVPDADASDAPDPHAPLHQANRLAAEFYHRRLCEADDAAAARTYLETRGVPRPLWEEFLLGWAPDAWDAVVGEAARQRISPEMLIEAGLVARSERTGGVYDRFRGRIVFPIRSPGGKVIGLSGRRLDDQEPKYLNSADSPVFAKGRTLFNLDLARGPIRKAGAALLVEGNFDVVALYGVGHRNVVAPLGTAFTPEQARILRRYTATVYLAYDGDRSGRRSAFRAGDLLLACGFAARVVDLPEGQDPDSLLRVGGAAAFEERLRESADVIEAKLAIVRDRIDLSDVMKKRRTIRRLVDAVAGVPDPVTRSLYLDRIASALDVPRETLAIEGRRRAAAQARPADSPPRPAARPPRAAAPPQDERFVLLHAISDEGWRQGALRICRPEYFSVPEYGALFRRLAAAPAGGDIRQWIERSPEQADARVLAELELWRGDQPLSDDVFEDSLERLLIKAIESGALPAFEATGERLQDALRRRDAEREIRRGRLRPGAS